MKIRLEWKRPADGVEIGLDDRLPTLMDGSKASVFRARSERTIPVAYEFSNLESPIALHLINSKSEEDFAAFITRFGFPRADHSVDAMVNAIDAEREWLTVGLLASTNGDSGRRTAEANLMLQDPAYAVSLKPSFQMEGQSGALKLVLQPDCLASYMRMEIALAHEVGASTAQCEHCSRLFITGPLTGRRSHAKYCSDRCRVAAMRARNAKEAKP